jgi:hypothetical protein
MNEAEIVNLVVENLGKYGALVVLLLRYVGPAIQELTPLVRDYLQVQKQNLSKIAMLCEAMDRRLALLETRVAALESRQ